MKTIKHLTCVMGLVLLAGCATTFKPWQLSKVEEGMDRTQVVKMLGEPDSVEQKDGVEILHYSYQEDFTPTSEITSQIDSARELRVAEFERSLKEFRYEVVLTDGKMTSYQKLED